MHRHDAAWPPALQRANTWALLSKRRDSCQLSAESSALPSQDLELPPEVAQAPVHAAETAAFAVPTPGVSASQRWLQKGNLAAQHAAAGAFDSAMRLLNRCRWQSF